MIFLIAADFRGFRERDDDDRNTTAVEFRFEALHLVQVMLARKSGEMPEKNQKQVILKIV